MKNIEYKKVKLINKFDSFEMMNYNKLINSDIIGIKTNLGTIRGLSKTTNDTIDTGDLVKLDDTWYEFKKSDSFVLIYNDLSVNHLKYKTRQKVKIVVDVKKDIDIDNMNLSDIEGVDETFSDFDTIRDFIFYNTKKANIPINEIKNINEYIKIRDCDREFINHKIIRES